MYMSFGDVSGLDDFFGLKGKSGGFGPHHQKPHHEKVIARPANLALERERAKKADLIILPRNIPGTRCDNCEYYSPHYCHHPQMQMPVKPNWCCSYWDSPGATRVWKGMK